MRATSAASRSASGSSFAEAFAFAVRAVASRRFFACASSACCSLWRLRASALVSVFVSAFASALPRAASLSLFAPLAFALFVAAAAAVAAATPVAAVPDASAAPFASARDRRLLSAPDAADDADATVWDAASSLTIVAGCAAEAAFCATCAAAPLAGSAFAGA